MNEDIKSFMHNQIWDFSKLPKGKNTLQNKWVYCLKEEYDGSKR